MQVIANSLLVPICIYSFYQATDTDDGKYAKVNRQFLLFLHLKCIREEVKI